jgi:DNA-binding transcriptional regulator GbsR (MarR family)
VVQDGERQLVEQISLVFESSGLSPVAGRIIGRLLLCEPREQSSAELSDYVGASKGSISTQTQMLVAMGLVVRSRKPGSRATWYAIRPHVWTDLLQLEIVRTQQLHALAEQAIALKQSQGAGIDDRLREFRGFTEFFLERLPALIDEWRSIQDNDP